MWILVAFLLVIGTGLAILWPYLRPQAPATSAAVPLHPQLAELYVQRDMLYQAIRDAQFDLETGKLSDEDFAHQTARLKQQAAAVLRSIDDLESELISPELDARLESQIADIRRQERPQGNGRNVQTERSIAAHQDKFCGQCGQPLRAGDRFCGKCGQPVQVPG